MHLPGRHIQPIHPVSYTHLDVYKRQSANRIEARLSLPKEQDAICRVFFFSFEIMIILSDSVLLAVLSAGGESAIIAHIISSHFRYEGDEIR